MCLDIRKSAHKDGKPLIATENITVYKVLTIKNQPPYKQNGTYKKGFEYKEHDFLKYETSISGRIWTSTISLGFHAFVKEKLAHSELAFWNDCKVVEMYIPKGAKYVIGKYGHIVSNRIVWLK